MRRAQSIERQADVKKARELEADREAVVVIIRNQTTLEKEKEKGSSKPSLTPV